MNLINSSILFGQEFAPGLCYKYKIASFFLFHFSFFEMMFHLNKSEVNHFAQNILNWERCFFICLYYVQKLEKEFSYSIHGCFVNSKLFF